ncbi:MAG: hypothetical protein BGO55_06890 [Sphingobacteriales bacterium 50-39]|nr:IPT/TIG domain-containing protein [Sphingobacteriales bacterium]OJW52978.1 MAG: hypothetical protein BGO55_06890 [Sphingobacteriales bacterium 50-39]
MNDTLTTQDSTATPANEITPLGQIIAGTMLILFILIPGYILIAWWPDRLPGAKEGIRPLYINERFHVRLAGIPDSSGMDTASLAGPARDRDSATTVQDTQKVAAKDSTPTHHARTGQHRHYAIKGLIHINTLLLILVAAAGFLGNMIYITSSFSTFVGAVKFKRSWLLWYFVKPFTAAGLALGVYFVFRGGFLNMSDDSTSINIYGLVTISILTGLYTDRATLKLGEVVNTIFGFRPDENDHRPDKLHQGQSLKVTGFSPSALVLGQVNTILITGENLDAQKLLITINDTAVNNPIISASTITFQYLYLPPATEAPPTEVKLVVKDESGKEYLSGTLKTTNPDPSKP